MFNIIIQFIKNLFWPKKKEEKNWRDGLIPSPIDFRDIPLSAVSTITTPTPERYKIPYGLTIKDQGSKPYCVGYACASIKEYLERKEGNFIEFDGDWIYNECKKIDGMPNVAGTTFRAGLEVLLKKGAKPLGGKEEDAEKYRIGGYVRVNCDFKSLKRAIYEFGAILMGFIGSNEGWRIAVIRPPKTGERTWGHATIGISFEVILTDGQNTWSERWGDEGLFHFLETYLPFESWAVLVDLPNNWKELLPKEDDKPKYFFANNLYPGMKNEEVKTLQDVLKWLGCLDKSIITTGYYGVKTTEAVRIYQQRKGLLQTGNFGPTTRATMNKELNTTGKL